MGACGHDGCHFEDHRSEISAVSGQLCGSMANQSLLTRYLLRPKRLIATTPTIEAAKVDGEETVTIDASGKQSNSKTTDVENVA